MLIKRVSRFSSNTDLAIMFKFIENDVSKIEISLDNQNWKELGFQGDKSDVYIFQGFKQHEIIKINYRYLKNNKWASEEVNIQNGFFSDPFIKKNNYKNNYKSAPFFEIKNMKTGLLDKLEILDQDTIEGDN